MNAEYLALCAETESAAFQTAGPPTTGGIFGRMIEMLRQWKDAGLKTGDFWTWLPLILQLIQTVGPKIAEIIKLIKDAIAKGETPGVFDLAQAVSSIP